MSAATRTLLAACALAASALVACAAEEGGGSSDDEPQQSQSSRCSPGEMRACPCLGMGTGMQVCNASGTYDACTSCPTVTPGPASAGSGSPPPPPPSLDAGGGPGDAGVNPAADAGPPPAGDGGTLTPDIGAVAGTSCGEALPTLCDLATQKCCVRSLKTDSCIPAAESCACDLPDCSVMEASCDGPEDCMAGQVCCGTFATTQFGGAAYTSFACTAQCSFNQNQREACHEGVTTCPSSLVCANSQLLSNVQVCIDAASIEQ